MSLSEAEVAAAFRDACHAELRALKPGNIFADAESRGMTVADFLASADAAAPPIGRRDLTVGQKILAAVHATRTVASHNTNLGIILLAAPLATAALAGGDRSLRDRLRDVIRGLTVDDARAAYQAIRLAEPGGMGETASEDIRQEPTVTLLEAMRLAEERDRIAWQYTHDFADVFERGLTALAEAEARRREPSWAITALYLNFLAAIPDSLVVRKHGMRTAERVQREASRWGNVLVGSLDPEPFRGDLLAFDRLLKQRGFNPGTTADLTVATLFARRLRAL